MKPPAQPGYLGNTEHPRPLLAYPPQELHRPDSRDLWNLDVFDQYAYNVSKVICQAENLLTKDQYHVRLVGTVDTINGFCQIN